MFAGSDLGGRSVNHRGSVMFRGGLPRDDCAGSRYGTLEKAEARDRGAKPRHRESVLDRKSARRGRVRACLSRPETRFVGPADQELLPQDHHRPRKLASRSLFWRAAELLRACDPDVRFVPAVSAEPAHGVLYCLVTEYAEHGTIHDHLASTQRPWSPVRPVEKSWRSSSSSTSCMGRERCTETSHR